MKPNQLQTSLWGLSSLSQRLRLANFKRKIWAEWRGSIICRKMVHRALGPAVHGIAFLQIEGWKTGPPSDFSLRFSAALNEKLSWEYHEWVSNRESSRLVRFWRDMGLFSRNWKHRRESNRVPDEVNLFAWAHTIAQQTKPTGSRKKR